MQRKWLTLAWAWWALAAVCLAWHMARTRYVKLDFREVYRDALTGRAWQPYRDLPLSVPDKPYPGTPLK